MKAWDWLLKVSSLISIKECNLTSKLEIFILLFFIAIVKKMRFLFVEELIDFFQLYLVAIPKFGHFINLCMSTCTCVTCMVNVHLLIQTILLYHWTCWLVNHQICTNSEPMESKKKLIDDCISVLLVKCTNLLKLADHVTIIRKTWWLHCHKMPSKSALPVVLT